MGMPATQTLSLTATRRPCRGPALAPGMAHFQYQALSGSSSEAGRCPPLRGYFGGCAWFLELIDALKEAADALGQHRERGQFLFRYRQFKSFCGSAEVVRRGRADGHQPTPTGMKRSVGKPSMTAWLAVETPRRGRFPPATAPSAAGARLPGGNSSKGEGVQEAHDRFHARQHGIVERLDLVHGARCPLAAAAHFVGQCPAGERLEVLELPGQLRLRHGSRPRLSSPGPATGRNARRRRSRHRSVDRIRGAESVVHAVRSCSRPPPRIRPAARALRRPCRRVRRSRNGSRCTPCPSGSCRRRPRTRHRRDCRSRPAR